jgi:hypothetical protein
MREYYKPLTLDCEQAIRNFAIGDIETQLGAAAYVLTGQVQVKHSLPPELFEIISNELGEKYGMPAVDFCHSILRPKKDIQKSHIKASVDGICYAAIDIPLKGTSGSLYRWLSGTYESQSKTFNGLIFYDLDWKDIPTTGATLELNSPHLVNVGIPNRAEASKTSDMWVFTIRLLGNSTFEMLRDVY